MALALVLVSAIPVAPAQATPSDRENESMPYQYIYLADFARLRHHAELGNVDALFQLGLMHYDPPESSGIGQSYRRAFALFFEAALRGHTTAQHNVGAMYWNGDYVAQNPVEGYAWFLLAASNGDSAGKRKQKLHAPDLTAQQIEEANVRVKDLQALLVKAKHNRDYDPHHYNIH
ncbi:sel1 repeat family protein [Permianibacter sp. IMCC34836]|uniref:tetratricopeptide repeat protein n=1 Tax=Permianibacter fluminis TaxID=2738515 RepID=UPI001557EFAA|nr:tetratricopeptide repeat protein [Permianibacter fluminis]NQD35508.1 sel1 repeat family protein [Permianibacter fluminis]